MTPEEFADRVERLRQDVADLREHDGVGVSGMTTIALWEAEDGLKKVQRELLLWPPVSIA